jgi:hypothetical protein
MQVDVTRIDGGCLRVQLAQPGAVFAMELAPPQVIDVCENIFNACQSVRGRQPPGMVGGVEVGFLEADTGQMFTFVAAHTEWRRVVEMFLNALGKDAIERELLARTKVMGHA